MGVALFQFHTLRDQTRKILTTLRQQQQQQEQHQTKLKRFKMLPESVKLPHAACSDALIFFFCARDLSVAPHSLTFLLPLVFFGFGLSIATVTHAAATAEQRRQHVSAFG